MPCFAEALTYRHGIILMIFFIASQCDGQLDPDYPLVNVSDEEANIDDTVQKSYVTTVGLIPTNPSNVFVAATFIQAAAPYYSSGAGLSGFIVIDSVESNTVASNLVLVTYSVHYALPVLLRQGANDALISSTIGNYQDVRTNVGTAGNTLASFFVFETSGDNFQFSGQTVCDGALVTCNSSQLECVETVNGVSVMCQSPCKVEFCKNNGTCAQEGIFAEPTCTCLSKADVYFLGPKCETLVALWMFILVIVGCFFLILAAIVIACCVYAAKRRQKEKEEEQYGIEDIKTFTNKAYLHNEPEKIERGLENGIREREVGARPRTPSAGRYSRSRNRTRRDSSSRRRRSRSYDRREGRRRRSGRTRSNSSSSYNSFNDSTDNSHDGTTVIPQSSISQRRKNSSSNNSSHANDRRTMATSDELNFSENNDVDIELRDQGTSPIRWVPTSQSPKPLPGTKMGKINIADRKGWMPSLGPQMFDIDVADNDDDTLPSPARLGVQPSSNTVDTDI